MALRLLEAQVPEDVCEEAERALAEVGAETVWKEPGGPLGTQVIAVLGAGRTGAAIDLLHERLANSAGFRVLVLPLDAVAPRPVASASAAGRAQAESAEAVSREEVYASVSAGARFSPTFLALTVLSATVAAIGLSTNNTAAVIGAMVVAPLLGPNIGVALAFTLGDFVLLREAAKSAALGLVAAYGTALLMGVGVEVRLDIPEIASRTGFGYGDLLLALAAGAAGTLAYTTGAPAYLVGVMVAVALLPPTVASGLLLGEGLVREALGGLLLVAANVTALTLAAMLTFLWKGIRPRAWWREDQARESARRGIAVFVALFALLTLAVLLSRLFGEVAG